MRHADLFWEREQERLLLALEGLVRERRGKLVLADTGDAEELRLALARPERPQLIHIACHGGAGPGGEPVLMLENADGRRRPVGAAELLGWARATPARAHRQRHGQSPLAGAHRRRRTRSADHGRVRPAADTAGSSRDVTVARSTSTLLRASC
jgi:hypothetical protein